VLGDTITHTENHASTSHPKPRAFGEQCATYFTRLQTNEMLTNVLYHIQDKKMR